jgi:hypothetical protein
VHHGVDLSVSIFPCPVIAAFFRALTSITMDGKLTEMRDGLIGLVAIHAPQPENSFK